MIFRLSVIPFLALSLLLLSGANEPLEDKPRSYSSSPNLKNPKRLFFLGQDLASIQGYLDNCAQCPTPDGFTTYLSLAYLNQVDFYGGSGFTKKGKHYPTNVDWGAGPLNAYTLAQTHPESHINIGLYMVDLADRIIRGELDKEIKQLSKFFHTFPENTFYLRIGYEFDGNWNNYTKYDYPHAYRYIVDKLRKAQVNNVQYVWHASASPVDDLIEGYHEDPMSFYPGDEYVDWVAISWFLPPAIGNPGSTQKELADEIVQIARQKNKPLMIAEAANQGYSNSALSKRNISPILDGPAGKNEVEMEATEIWSAWYAPFFAWIKLNQDVVMGLSYINAHWDQQQMWGPPYQQGYWGDSRIEANDTIRQYWIEAFADPIWQ